MGAKKSKSHWITTANFFSDLEPLTSAPMAFFLGAGASVSSGIKAAGPLVREWLEELRISDCPHLDSSEWMTAATLSEKLGEEYKDFDAANPGSHYSVTYDKRFANPAEGVTRIIAEVERGKPSVGYMRLSQILTTTRHNIVITPNFDDLIRRSTEEFTRTSPVVIGHESLAHFTLREWDRPIILKIHRDRFYDPLSHPKDLRELPDQWQEALRGLFGKRWIVFVGYGGNDPDIVSFFLSLKQGDIGPGIIWTSISGSSGPSTPSQGLWDQLKRLGARFVVHNGFDDFYLRMGVACRLPSFWEAFDRLQERRSFEARALASDAVRNPGDVSFSAQFSPYALDREDRPEARALNYAIAARKSDSPLVLNNAASAALDVGKGRLAIRLAKLAVGKEPSNVLYWYNLATILHETGNDAEAVAAFDSALTLSPTHLDSLINKGSVLCDRGDYVGALNCAASAIMIDPFSFEAHYNRAMALKQLGRVDEAIDGFQRALWEDPTCFEALSMIGQILAEKGEQEQALSYFEKSLLLDPRDDVAWNNLGIALSELGRVGEALFALRQAQLLQPGDEVITANILEIGADYEGGTIPFSFSGE
jgi:tetratricopeptide (TPR) repeat protein